MATAAEIQQFLATLEKLPVLRKPALGFGEDLRIESEDTLGAVLIHEGQVVHLSAFTRNGQPKSLGWVIL